MRDFFGPDGPFSEKRRGIWLLMCGCSWMLLFIYGTFKLLWMREWGYALVTCTILASGPLVAGVTIWNRNRRARADAAEDALADALAPVPPPAPAAD